MTQTPDEGALAVVAPRWGVRPRIFFTVSVAYLLILAGIGVAYFKINFRIYDPQHMLYIAWYGSLGGVMASVYGLIRHAFKWNAAWNFWYIVRPLSSAVFGVVGYMIYISIVEASLIPPANQANKHSPPTILGYVIAFALGYREDIFRELLRRVFELLATAGGADTQPPSAPAKLEATLIDDGCRVGLSWGKSSDNVAVTAYNIYRDYVLLTTLRVDPEHPQDRISFVDQSDAAAHHFYAVTAADGAGNESPLTGPIRAMRQLDGLPPANSSFDRTNPAKSASARLQSTPERSEQSPAALAEAAD